MSDSRYIEHQRQVARAADTRLRALNAAIAERLPDVTAELVALGARVVIVFGSVVRGEANDDSDLDVAVEGLPDSRFFDAMSRAARAAGRPVDLVRMEDASPTLRDRIMADGEVLHRGA